MTPDLSATRPRLLRITTGLLIAIGAVSCSALDKLLTVERSAPMALIDMDAQATGAGYSTNPLAAFYRTIGGTPLTYSANGTPNDSCSTRLPGGGFFPDETNDLIGAGSFVVVRTPTGADTLRNPSLSPNVYQSASAFAFMPGDTVTFAIPGQSDGFPGATLAMKTSEAFSVSSPLVFPASGEAMPVEWTAPTGPGSIFVVTIPYAISPQNAYMVYCQFVDDGHAAIPAAFIAPIPSAVAGQRAPIHFQRIRTALTGVAGTDALINAVSTFSYPSP